MKYHVNGEGNAGLCRATAGACPFGSAEDHYGSREEAFEAYATAMGGSFSGGLKKVAAVTMEDSWGELVEITPGVITKEVEWIYENGQCLAFAVSLARERDWEIVGYVGLEANEDYDEDDAEEAEEQGETYDEPEYTSVFFHAYAKRPDGMLVDIKGVHDPATFDATDFARGERMETYSIDDARYHFEDSMAPQDYATASSFTKVVEQKIAQA